jgi:DNA-binding NtrC family response regulator
LPGIIGFVPVSTITAGPDGSRERPSASSWSLTVALECAQLTSAPARVGLAGLTELEIGRGDARAFTRNGSRARLDLPDGWVSQLHVRLAADDDGWLLEDAGSKNGTLVNGKRSEHARLTDGDVIECGGTFLVVRRADGPDALTEAEGPTDALRTLAPALARELAVLPKIARGRLPILVRGETGTGKDVVANAIHALSTRSGGTFVPVNCGAIPATLVESELFGSRRGAFSGAEDRAGLVRSADGGTLFLDEVAELPAASQAALLRVLQQGEVLPLGASKSISVDVRVVAATHQPLEQLVADGRFRRDLFARLRGYELRLPALRERLDDLGLLVAALLPRIEPDRPPRRLERAAGRALFAHPWPFHVRELEQTLRAAVAVAAGPELRVSDLQLAAPIASAAAATSTTDADHERERLVAALQQHGGNISAVARQLVTSRSQVQRLMTRYGLDGATFKRS